MWRARAVFEIAVLSALILLTRCANWRDVFVAGQVYFVDADCYARMARVQMVAANPGTVVRHEQFENYPAGIEPHTTAPLDYLIFGLSLFLRGVSAQPIDLAGAFMSPLLALAGGWFLWWWARGLAVAYWRSAALFYALNPILAHGTALGRPDHQSLLIVLMLIALAAEWRLLTGVSRLWSAVSGLAWGMALWVSLYEPLVLLVMLLLGYALFAREQLTSRERRLGWGLLAGLLVIAILIERRLPVIPPAAMRGYLANWASTIGELRAPGLTNGWWIWLGGFLFISPIVLLLASRQSRLRAPLVWLLFVTLALAWREARWGYFFALLFALTIPTQLATFRRPWIGWTVILFALLPIFQYWDARFWPNDIELQRAAQNRREAVEWRVAAVALRGTEGALLAPWWLSPSAGYWSGKAAVAGSAHEDIVGIVASASFFLTADTAAARRLLQQDHVKWVLSYDWERVAENSAAILGRTSPQKPLCRILDARPGEAPDFLRLRAQNGTAKIYEFSNK